VNHKVVFGLIKEKYYSPGLSFKVKIQLRTCVKCVSYNIKKPLKSKIGSKLGSHCRESLSCDLVGPLPSSGNQYKYIFAAIDTYSREIFLMPLKSTSSDEVARAFLALVEQDGLFTYLEADGGLCSKHRLDNKILSQLGIITRISNHQSSWQASVERCNQTVLIRLLKLMDDDKDYSNWSNLLKKVAFSINLTPTKSLGGLTPYQITRTYPVRSLSMCKLVIPRSKLERDFMHFQKCIN
jgi:hypothetical protein